MSEAKRIEGDRGLRGALYAVAVVGLGTALVAAAWFGLRPALGVALGALIGVANLYVLGLVVRGLLRSSGRRLPWALLAALKFCALVGGSYALVCAGVVELLPLAIGYGALPLGIVAGQLIAAPAAGEEG